MADDGSVDFEEGEIIEEVFYYNIGIFFSLSMFKKSKVIISLEQNLL